MKDRTKRSCANCGKSFYGTGDNYYCPECAKKKKLDTVIKIRKCQDCGMEFMGGPRAKRCPQCSDEAKKEAQKRFRKTGTKRPLGSIDICEMCGNKYVVTSGRQKYCSDECQHIALLEWQRDRKSEYNKRTRQDEKKKEARKNVKKICLYCLREFSSSTSTNLCSDYCRRENKKINQCKADLKRGMKRDLNKYENQRKEYRKKVGGAGNE